MTLGSNLLLKKNAAILIGIPLLSINFFAAAQDAPTVKREPTHGVSILIVKAVNPTVDENGNAQFFVRMTKSTMIGFPFSRKLAVVFDDAMLNDKDLQCPVINIEGRQRKIKEVKRGTLQVNTTVTPEERKMIDESRCFIATPSPSLSEIEFQSQSQGPSDYTR